MTNYTLVFLHGWGMNSAVFDDLVKAIDNRYSCLCLDLPGYGNATDCDIPSDKYDLESISRWIENKLPSNAILVGWSLGGLVAQYVAINMPSKVAGLITIASSPKFEQSTDWQGIAPEVLKFFHQQLSDDHAKTLTRFIAIQMQGIVDMSERKKAIKLLSSKLLSMAQPSKWVLDKGLDILQFEDLRSVIKDIKVPTLRLYGRLDSLVPASVISKIEAISTCDSLVYQKASHAPFVTHLQELVSDIQDFVHSQYN